MHPYLNEKIALTTKHEKLKLIAPAFSEFVGCEVFEINVDTDQLGTFSGEIDRVAPPRETAMQKARLGMKETGILLGIASEGSVGPDPVVPFIHSNVEHLVLVDDQRGIVISETFRSFEITAATIKAFPGQDLTDFLKRADFPNHALIVRPNTHIIRNCIKGITNFDQLLDAIETSAQHSPDGFVVIESDLRAMNSPSRQKNIKEVANLLAKRVSQICPKCLTPGWGRIGFETGLKCALCGLPNSQAIRQEKLGCVKCDYGELGAVVATKLDPAQCNFCNP